ncbi:MAG: outer membrane lipoprotein-sorting protein [Myxococcaceae bacterium]
MNALVLAAVLSAAPPPNVPACPSSEDQPNVEELVKRTEQLLDGKSSISVMTMAIKTPSWSRKIKMKVWARGQDYALIRVLEGGPHEAGMMTLKREKQLWNYLPQAGRVMKLPSGMLGDSWMGSDFTNDDLVKGSSITKDFDAKVDPKGIEVDGKKAWHVVLIPKKDAVVVWGKIEMLVDRASCVPLEQRFFDEEGKQVRKMAFSDFKDVGWRHFPQKMTVVPSEPGRETSITYESIEFDPEISDDTFSLHRLQQEH